LKHNEILDSLFRKITTFTFVYFQFNLRQ